MKPVRLARLACIVVACLAPPASADVRVTPVAGTSHHLRAEVAGLPPGGLAQLALVGPQGREAPAIHLEPVGASAEPVALAIVLHGQEVWMGNTSIEPPDSPAAYAGALASVRAAVEDLASSRQLPVGSQGALIRYADTVRLVHPLGGLEALPAAVGSEHDYHRRLGAAMLDGVSAGVEVLAGAPQRRRVLLVLGDGNDVSAAAAPRIARLQERAARAGIVITGVVWKGALSDESVTQLADLTSRLRTVTDVADLRVEALRLVTDAIAVTAVTFDARALLRDGGPLTLRLRVGTELRDVEPLVLAPPVADGRAWWWGQLAAGVALMFVSAGLLWVRAGRGGRAVG